MGIGPEKKSVSKEVKSGLRLILGEDKRINRIRRIG
jgi:hypothetical protein